MRYNPSFYLLIILASATCNKAKVSGPGDKTYVAVNQNTRTIDDLGDCSSEGQTECADGILKTCSSGKWLTTSCTAPESCLQNAAQPGTYACQASALPSCPATTAPTNPNNFIVFSKVKGKLDYAEVAVYGSPRIVSVKTSVNDAMVRHESSPANLWKTGLTFAPTTLSFSATDEAGYEQPSAVYAWGGPSGANALPVFQKMTAVRDANVIVTSKAGPLESASAGPLPLDGDTLGLSLQTVNLDDGQKALLRALKPAYLRFPAGPNAPRLTFARSGGGANSITPQMIDAFVAVCSAVGAQPVLGVNLNNGTLEQAKDMVRYANVDNKHKIVWWQLGYSPDLAANQPSDMTSYTTSVNGFAQGMRSVDNSILFVGGEVSADHAIGDGGAKDMLTPVMANAANSLAAFSWRLTPLDSTQTNALSSAFFDANNVLLEHAWDWLPVGQDYVGTAMKGLRQQQQKLAPATQVWVSEFTIDTGTQRGRGISDRVFGGLWAADVMGRLLDAGVDTSFYMSFNGSSNEGLTLVDVAPGNTLRPDYYSLWLYANLWGDKQVLSQSSLRGEVASHAALRAADNTLRVLLINKTDVQRNVRVFLKDFVPRGSSTYTIAGAGGDAFIATLNGTALTPDNATLGSQAVKGVAGPSCADSTVTLPALSTMLIIFVP